MNNYISYSLFESKQPHGNRWWDSSLGKKNRYWFNIPALIAINNICFKDFKTIIHIEKRLSVENPLFELLKMIEKETGCLRINICNYNFLGTEGAIWRFCTLWEDFDFLMCRDIDSLPNSDELKAVKYFAQSKYIISNMRSSKFHNVKCTCLLAGLCNFKKEAKKFLIEKDFDSFYSQMKPNWGSDQELLVHRFVNSLSDTELSNSFLDIPINEARTACTKIDGFNASQPSFEELDKIKLETTDVFEVLNSFTNWAGQPTDIRGRKLISILDMKYDVCKIIKNILNSSNLFRSFYGV